MDFSDQRQSYEKNSLSELNLPKNPFTLFASWMDEAVKANTPEPYAMSLATCGADHLPSVRTVLLREVTTNGFVFYTNYLSDKGEDVAQNPNAEVLFFWHDLERQIRIQGKIAKIDRAKPSVTINVHMTAKWGRGSVILKVVMSLTVKSWKQNSRNSNRSIPESDRACSRLLGRLRIKSRKV